MKNALEKKESYMIQGRKLELVECGKDSSSTIYSHSVASMKEITPKRLLEKAKRKKAHQKRKGGESMYFCFESSRFYLAVVFNVKQAPCYLRESGRREQSLSGTCRSSLEYINFSGYLKDYLKEKIKNAELG